MFKEFNNTIKIRLFVQFIQGLIMKAIMPFMALYFTDLYNPIYAGFILSITVIINFLVTFYGGYIGDIFSRKKIIIITQLGVIITLIGMIGSFFLEHKLLLFTLCYILFNICISLQRPAIDAILIDAVDKNNKKQVYTISYWLGNISGILGIFIGGTFYQYKLTLFILSICISILATLLLYEGLPNENTVITYKNEKKEIKDLFNEYFQVLKDHRYSLLIIGNSFFILLELTLQSNVIIRLRDEFGIFNFIGYKINGTNMFSLITIINTLIVIFCTFIINKIINKLDDNIGLKIGLLLYGLGYIIILSNNNFYILIISIIISSIGELIYLPKFYSLSIDLIPKEKRAKYSAFSSLGFNLANFISRVLIVINVYIPSIILSIVFSIFWILASILVYRSLVKRNDKVNI